MDCGVQVEVSKVLVVVMGGGVVVVVVRQLQALEMRWEGVLVGLSEGLEGVRLHLRRGRRLRCRLVLSWCCWT